MTRPAIVQIHAAGARLSVVPLAGFGGGYREMANPVDAGLDGSALEDALREALGRSDLSRDALQRHPRLPAARTAFAKARDVSDKRGEEHRMWQLVREESGAFALQQMARPADAQGFVPSGQPLEVADLAQAAAAIRITITDDLPTRPAS